MSRPIKFKAFCTDRREFVKIIDLGVFGTGEVREVSYTYESEPYERYSSPVKGSNIRLITYTEEAGEVQKKYEFK